jgi:hypothetical protein
VTSVSNYCPQCGKRIKDPQSNFCPSCGASLHQQSSFNNQQIPWSKKEEELPAAAETIISLNNVAGIIALLFGIFFLIIGVVSIIVFVGLFILIFAFVNFLIRWKLNEINTLIKEKRFNQARNEQLIWMILGFLLGGIIIGIILLIAYVKYDEIR